MSTTSPAVVCMSKPQIDILNARTNLILEMAGQGAGKTMNIGVSTAIMVEQVPQIKGFIGANTQRQLSQSTVTRCLEVWKTIKGWTQYKKTNPDGVFVINKQPPPHFVQYHELESYHGTICFQNGCLIFIGSLENYEAHDGKEFGWAHLDETKDTKKEALTEVIGARLRQYGLWFHKDNGNFFYNDRITIEEAKEQNLGAFNPLYVHTSPALGGVEWLNEYFKINKKEREIREALADPFSYYHYQDEFTTVVIYQTYWNEHNLPPNYIEKRRRELSESEQLMLIDGYPFSKTGSEYFAEFSRKKHVVPSIPVDFTNTIAISFDFNVVPYMTGIVGQTDFVTKYYNFETGEKKDYLEEEEFNQGFQAIEVMRIKISKEMPYYPPQNETEQLCEGFTSWLDSNEAVCDVNTYGDASGQNRIPGMGNDSNFKTIQTTISLKYYCTKKVRKANIGVLKRKTFMNRLFKGEAFPELEIYISAECELLIKDLEFLKQAPDGGKHKEKEVDPSTKKSYEKIGHMSDALEYYVCELCYDYIKNIA